MNEYQLPFEDEGPVPLQDEDTSEAILYGPAYNWIKNVLWIWDEIEEYLRNKADSLDSQILDREWSYYVMVHNPYLINARSPPVNEVNHLQDLFTLRSLTKCLAAMKKLKEYRKQNIAWARMKGIERYVKGMEDRGITESEWGMATSKFGMDPITFDNIHGDGPMGYEEEDVDIKKVMMAIMGDEEYKKFEQRIEGKKDEPGSEAAEEEPDVPDLSYIECLKDIFEDPIRKAAWMIEVSADVCTRAAEYWDDMNADGRRIIDILISYSEG